MIYLNNGDTFTVNKLDQFIIPKYVERRGYIYIAQDSNFPDYIKIGRSSDVEARLKNYNDYKPSLSMKMHCVSKAFVNVWIVEEKILEHLYTHEVLPTPFKREWFHLDHLELCERLIVEAEGCFDLWIG